MKRINVILLSNKEPEDKNIIWLKDKKLYIWEGGWEPICDSDITVNPEDITVDLSEYLKKIEANSLYQLKGNYALVRDLPTKVSQLTNDSRYITVSGIPDDYVKLNQLKTKQDVLTAGEGINITNNVIKCTLDTSLYKVVVSLPSVGEENKIYLVESNTKGTSNVYVEYAYVNNAWEILGEYRAEINLAPYALKTEIPNKVSELENDSNYVHTVNNKQSTDGTVTINGEDINVPFYAMNDSGELEFHESTVSELAHSLTDGITILALNLLDVYDNKANTSDIPTKLSLLEKDLTGDDIIVSGEATTTDGGKQPFESSLNNFSADVLTSIISFSEDIQNLSENKLNKTDLPDSETYILNFNVSDGVNTGSYDKSAYDELRAAIDAGKLIIIAGTVTRVTADSQAKSGDYVVIRYSTPRISDDNKSVTISFYELKFGIIDSDGTYKYLSKAIHKTIS